MQEIGADRDGTSIVFAHWMSMVQMFAANSEIGIETQRFLIQNTQNRDAAAMHAKLDELVYAVKKADARFIGIEHLTDKELAVILDEVEQRALAVHAGKPARAVRGKPAVRIEDLTTAAPQAGVAK